MPKVIAAILLLQSGGVDSSEPPTVTAVRVDRAPVVDGRLDDPVWNLAPPVTDFRQTDPDEGAPVSEATAVRVLYDGTAVYVGARLFDSAPARIVRRLARRDASTHSDEFRVFLDSYHDRRTAFEFIVNAAGVKKDVLIGDDGDFDDASWDPVWEAATSVDALGWTAEIRIPLTQLRFSKAQDQVWGAHFVRWIERKQEQALFPLIGKKENGLVSRFADLVGIHGVDAPKRLELLPYTVGRGTYLEPKDRGNPFERRSSYHSGAGADVKYGVSSSLTLDATLNPDFGQVEVDETFVNLTAFEQFLAEHRPFFVEGTEIFTFGSNGGGATNFSGRPLKLEAPPPLLPKLKISVPSTKNGRCSARNCSKAVRFTNVSSTSTCPKSGFRVASSVRLELTPYFTSAPAPEWYDDRRSKGFPRSFGSRYVPRPTV